MAYARGFLAVLPGEPLEAEDAERLGLVTFAPDDIDWADVNLNAASYPAIISPANEASVRLAERLGFRRELDATYRGETIALFRRPRP